MKVFKLLMHLWLQQHLFGGVQKDLGSSFLLGCFGLSNLQEGAGMILPQLTYTFNDHIEVMAKGTIAVGDKERSEFASLKSSAQLKITGFF